MVDLAFSLAPDVATEMRHWMAFLASERRMSPKTLEAYQRDVAQFLGFLTGHLGEPPSPEAVTVPESPPPDRARAVWI